MINDIYFKIIHNEFNIIIKHQAYKHNNITSTLSHLHIFIKFHQVHKSLSFTNAHIHQAHKYDTYQLYAMRYRHDSICMWYRSSPRSSPQHTTISLSLPIWIQSIRVIANMDINIWVIANMDINIWVIVNMDINIRIKSAWTYDSIMHVHQQIINILHTFFHCQYHHHFACKNSLPLINHHH